MSTIVQHPDWLAIGARAEIIRRLGRSIAWRKTVTVVRHTATSVVVAGSGGLGAQERFVAKGNRYVLTPKYIDYQTTLEPLTPKTDQDEGVDG